MSKSAWSKVERIHGARIPTRESLFNMMEGLGYQKGEATTKTVDALVERQACECPMLVSQIATEHAKHKENQSE